MSSCIGSLSIIDGCKEASNVGLELQDELTYEQWEKIGFDLTKIGRAWQWWAGDWVIYGNQKYGETYTAAIDATGLSVKRLKNIASVCRSFERSRRRDVLTFKHHEEVQALNEKLQTELLDLAEGERWSCARLREEVEKRRIVDDSSIEDSENEQEEYEDADESEEAEEESWPEQCVTAFRKSETRLETLRTLVDELEPFEREVVKEWLS